MTTTSYQRAEKLAQPIFCNAWIAPDGSMYYADGGEYNKHLDTAEQLFWELFGIDSDGIGDDMLINRGWVELSTSRSSLIYGYAPVECILDSLTTAQYNTLLVALEDAKRNPRYAKFVQPMADILFSK